MVNSRGYFINVEGMPRRRAHMHDQLRSMELHDVIDRWPAVDAADYQDLANTSYAPGHWRSAKWELSKFEVAVFESHRSIWQQMVQTGEGPVVVLEDDVVLSNRFREVMVDLAMIDSHFDVVKLDGIFKTRRFGPPLEMESYTQLNFAIRPIVQTISSAAGYILSNEGAAKLVGWSTSYSDGVDDFLFQPRDDYRLYQAFPAVCAQGVTLLSRRELVETQPLFVRGENAPNYVAARRSGGPIAFRMVREIKRGMRRLRRILFEDKRLIGSSGFIGVVPLADDLNRTL